MKKYNDVAITASMKPALAIPFTILVVIYPIFNRYTSPLPFLTLSEFLLLLLFAVILFRTGLVNSRVLWAIIPFIGYLAIHILLDITTVSGEAGNDAIGTALRLIFIYSMIAMLSRDFFSVSLGEKVLLGVATAVAIYGLIQVLFSFLNISLSTYIPFLPVMDDLNSDQLIVDRMSYGARFRCQSVLNEPSHLCCYLILPLILCLFPAGRPGKVINYPAAILFSLVCFASASSTGIIVVVAVWLLHFFGPKKWTGRPKLSSLFAFVVVLAASAALFYITGLWDYFVSRTFGNSGDLSGILSGTRFYALDDMFGASDSLYGVLFGTGLAKTAEFLPGFARIYLCLGLVGLTLVAWMLGKLLHDGDVRSRIILAFFIILNIGTEIILGNFAVYYLPFCLPEPGASMTRCPESESEEIIRL